MAPRNRRRWDDLAQGSKRRWIAAHGGPRSLPPAARARRAQRAYEAGVHLPEEHTGHQRAVRTFQSVPTTSGTMPISTTSAVEARRLGEYSADLRDLLAGSLDPKDFRRRWSRRSRAVGNRELIADPAAAIATATESGPAPQPFYERRRMSRRRAS